MNALIDDLGLNSSNAQQQRVRTFTNAICIETVGEPNNHAFNRSEYSRIMLQRIMESDPNFLSPPTPIASPKKGIFFHYHDEDEDEDSLHPMDVFIYLFLYSNPLFKQVLLKQLLSVQKALPLILHPDKNDPPIFICYAYRSLKYYWIENSLALTCTLPTTDLPIVAFLRVGKINNGKSSKSELLNKVLEVDNCYFNYTSDGYVENSHVYSGTVEVNWCTPTGNCSHDLHSQPVAFMNLRGDAIEYTKQCNFLSKVCNLACIFFSMSDLTEDDLLKLESIYNNCDPCKCILICLKYDKKIANRYVSKFSNSLISITYKNIMATAKDIRAIIKDYLPYKTKSNNSLLYCKHVALECKIDIDEVDDNIKLFITQAERICRKIYRLEESIVINDSIDDYLPLQGKGWRDFCTVDKQRYKRLIPFNECDGNERQVLGRTMQRGIIIQDKPTYLVCLLGTLNQNCHNRNNLNYLWSYLIDELNTICFTLSGQSSSLNNSNEMLSPSNNNTASISLSSQFPVNSVIEIVNDVMPNSISTCQLQQSLPLVKGKDKIISIEHVMREIVQFYVTYSASKSEDQEIIKELYEMDPENLPIIAAKLLLCGYPLEILDGFVNHVPLAWIHSVLQSLSKIEGETERIFVVSVLGVQSSGKSTLLNTMFGVQFPVSSGRCTRGVYMQLVRVESKGLGYRYVVLIDTEGLKGNGSENIERDNELATFVVGLSDLTIVNIICEYITVLQDILQIIALAFIRMRLSYAKPKCIFVHHNVNDPIACKNLQPERSQFIETLNLMTCCAAVHEHQTENFKTFNDVISFDYNKDVVYFPSPFQGPPAMQSLTEAYSTSAKELKLNILNSCQENKADFNTFSTLGSKIIKLWESIMKENFAFHYLNVVEVRSHHQLEMELCHWSCQFSQNMAAWATKAINNIMNVDCEELHNLQSKLKAELMELSWSEHIQEQRRIITEYFEISKSNGLFIKWKVETQDYFRLYREKEKRKIEQDIDKLLNLQIKSFTLNQHFMECEKALLSKHQNLLDELRKENRLLQNVDDIDLLFEENWDKWISDLSLVNFQLDIPSCDLNTEIKLALIESTHFDTIIPEQRLKLLEFTTNFVQIGQNEFTLGQDHYIVKDNINDTARNIFRTFSSMFDYLINIFPDKYTSFSERSENDDVHTRVKTRMFRINETCEAYLDSLPTIGDFNLIFVQTLIDIVVGKIREINHTESQLVINNAIEYSNLFIYEYAFYQCCKAISLFEKMQIAFRETMNKDFQLANIKRELKESFHSQYKNISSENSSAKKLAGILFEGIKNSIECEMRDSVVNHFMEEHQYIFRSRKLLQLHILKELAKLKSFNKYISYIEYPIQFMKEWIYQKLNSYCSIEIITHIYQIDINSKIRSTSDQLIEISDQITNLKDYHTPICASTTDQERVTLWKNWKKLFHEKIIKKVRGIQFYDLQYLDHYIIYNYHYFSDCLKIHLNSKLDLFDWREWSIRVVTKSNISQNVITETLLECKALCPFCQEPCQMSMHPDNKHYCGSFHRPKGLCGGFHGNDKSFSITDCNTSLAENKKFVFKGVEYLYSRYYNVNAEFAKWKISPSDAADSKYWQWVLYYFQDDFCKYYKFTKNAKAEKWSMLTDSEIIKDLEMHYHNFLFKMS